ncbi:MAG: transcriptional repressor LexA [Firmicutes bacterium]|nr:transcriptional repressor LexA [Bacillota bacterium]
MSNMTRGNGKEKQAAILDFIRKEVATRGYPPSVREIGDAIGVLSTSTVHGHLAKLERDGAIRRDPTKPRAIELIGEQRASATGRVPLLGRVTAGLPITAVQDVEDYIPLPPGVSDRGDAIFALRVSGQSMIDAGIHDGDIVYVERQSSARNGEIVVAMTEDGEATVKRFFQERDHIRLQPENSSMAPLLYDSVTILGRVVGLWRVIA